MLVVTPAGAKSYAVDYRAGSGRGAPKRRLTIGKHGSPWTAETARVEAKRLLAEVAAGRDPAMARQADRKALTFDELIDLYLAEGVGHKKASTLKADCGRIEHHLRPLLGKLRADRIARADVERMRNAVTAGKTAQKIEDGEKRPSGQHGQGWQGRRRAMRRAGRCDLRLRDRARPVRRQPGARSKKAPVRKVERFLSEAEIARLAEALDAEADRSGNPYPSAAIKLLLLTGCRRGEIVNLCWDHVDFERECLRLPDSKTGAKIVYLNAPARALAPATPAHGGQPAGDPWHAGRQRERRHRQGVGGHARAAAGLADVRLHDLRHSFASVGAAGGLSLPIIGALLGHKHATTTARYAHLSADPLRAANDAVGARIAAAMRRNADAGPAANVWAGPREKARPGDSDGPSRPRARRLMQITRDNWSGLPSR